MPHPVAVDYVSAGRLGDCDHAAVDMVGNARHHEFRRLPKPVRPTLADKIVIAADAAGGHDHDLCFQCKIAHDVARTRCATLDTAGFENVAADPVYASAACCQLVDAMTKPKRNKPALFGVSDAADERLDQAWAGTPRYVKAGHRVAVLRRGHPATFGPPDDREKPNALRMEPSPFFPRRKIHIGLCPLARPIILFAVERGRCHPVLHRKVAAIANAHTPLLGRVYEKKPSERPERLPAE